jgi:hypothetical protein
VAKRLYKIRYIRSFFLYKNSSAKSIYGKDIVINLPESKDDVIFVANTHRKILNNASVIKSVQIGSGKDFSSKLTMTLDIKHKESVFVYVRKFDGSIEELEPTLTLTGLSISSKYSGEYFFVKKAEVNQLANNIPKSFALYQNYPNPFNPETTISFDLKEQAKIRLEIYNSIGQRIKVLLNAVLDANTHQVKWAGKNSFGTQVASGVYFYRLVTPNKVFTNKMILLK